VAVAVDLQAARISGEGVSGQLALESALLRKLMADI
jgi:hypothetical protein